MSDLAYLAGYRDGLQDALDIACRAADWLQENPDALDSFEILARIITDIQTKEAQVG